MEFPRVTEILRCFTKYDKVPANILERAAERGTSVHALCAGIAKGAWIPDSMIDEELIGYVNSFKKWAELQVVKFEVVENRYHDSERKYSGQVDYVIQGHDGKLYLVDIKTSSRPQRTYPVQMGAYNILLRSHNVQINGGMIVYLNKSGEFPEIHFLEEMDEEMHIFLSALDCWHYFNKGIKYVGTDTNAE